jgi:penicillin-binding protein 1C
MMKHWLHQHPKRAVTSVLVLLALLAFWLCLPEPLFTRPHSTILLTEQGELLGARIAEDGQWRFPATKLVADKFRQAIIHYEDKRFDTHLGVDPVALVRAIKLNFAAGHIVSGGSTLSMQVIRLAKNNPKRSYREKIIEMIQALRLELRYNKDEIIALYASHAPFGGNVVGLDTAAWRYFGRSAEQLSWAEAATLAVLPNSPSLIHPGRNRERLQQKRDQLLEKLMQQDLMSKTELKLAMLEPLPDKPVPLPRVAPHLLDTLSKKGKGKRLVTTLDAELQRKVTQTVQQHSRQLVLQGINNAAAIVIDHQDFSVRAYVGNSALHGPAEHGYAIDIIHRPRSTGSILKPFLFASMIQQSEILAKTLIVDLPTQYGGYIPENYDHRYRGAVPAQLALVRSLNVPAVRMLQRHGVHRFYDFLSNMGMSTLHRRAEDYGLTLILGGAEGNLWDLSNMYANLAYIARQQHNDTTARYHQARVLNGETTATKHQVELNPAAAWITLNALLEVNRPGIDSYWKNFSSSRKLAWKTGTSYGLRDGWAIGNTGR